MYTLDSKLSNGKTLPCSFKVILRKMYCLKSIYQAVMNNEPYNTCIQIKTWMKLHAFQH